MEVSGSGSSLGISAGWDNSTTSPPGPECSVSVPHTELRSSHQSHAQPVDSSLDTTGSLDLETLSSAMLNGGIDQGRAGCSSPTPEREEEEDVVDRCLPRNRLDLTREVNGEFKISCL